MVFVNIFPGFRLLSVREIFVSSPSSMATGFYPKHFTSVLTNRAVHWRLGGTWNDLITKAKRVWSKLSDEDLDVTAGSYDELVGRINRASGESRGSVHMKLFRD